MNASILELDQTEQSQASNSKINKATLKPDINKRLPFSPLLNGLNDTISLMACVVHADLTHFLHQFEEKNGCRSDSEKNYDSLMSAQKGIKEIMVIIGGFDEALAVISKQLPQAHYEPSLFDDVFSMLARANGVLALIYHVLNDSDSDRTDSDCIYYAIESVIQITTDIRKAAENHQA